MRLGKIEIVELEFRREVELGSMIELRLDCGGFIKRRIVVVFDSERVRGFEMCRDNRLGMHFRVSRCLDMQLRKIEIVELELRRDVELGGKIELGVDCESFIEGRIVVALGGGMSGLACGNDRRRFGSHGLGNRRRVALEARGERVLEIVVERHRRRHRQAGSPQPAAAQRRRRLVIGELAHQFLFEIDPEIIVRDGLHGRRRGNGRLASGLYGRGRSGRRVRWQAVERAVRRGSKPMILVSSANGSSSFKSIGSAIFRLLLSAILFPVLAPSPTPATSICGPYQSNVGKR